MSGGSISNVNSDGVDASGGTVVLDEVDIQSSDDDGISLSGTADAEVIDSSVFDNGAYGLRCNGGAADPGVSTVSLELCSFTSSGNSLGALLMTNGCELDWSCTVDGDDDDSSAGDDDDSSAGDDDDSAVGDDDDSAAGDDDSAAGDDDDSGN